ncbi:MAG: hypothetical protein DI547_04875 [Sphingobium sp.]|nr:MAG: hypothetical protein DI547_04875 [Sphingobium sp.]
MSSRQLTIFRCAVRGGTPLEAAAQLAGMTIGEARLTLEADRADPPPPDAYLWVGDHQQRKEDPMARNAKKKDDEVKEIVKPDFDRAVRIYREDIKPAQAKVGEYAQEQSTAYKELKKGCHLDPAAAKMAFKLDQMEDHKRDDYLRTLYGLMDKLNIGISADLVDQMGDGEAPSMPVRERSRPGLVTVN